jgi:hypothetical protein
MESEIFYTSHIQKIPTLHPKLSMMNVRNFLKHFPLKIHFNIILLSMAIYPKWFLKFWISDPKFIYQIFKLRLFNANTPLYSSF